MFTLILCENLVFTMWYSTLKFWWCDEKKSVHTYLGEEKFDKLRIIEDMKIEELQKKFHEDVSVLFYLKKVINLKIKKSVNTKLNFF